MILKELVDYLIYGDLSQVFIGTDAPIRPENIKKLSININAALLEIYKTLPLLEEEVIIQQYAHISNYHLIKDYAETNVASPKPYKYIKDSSYRPFKDNVLRIVRAYTELGDEVVLNDPIMTDSWYTPTYNTITIPYPSNDSAISIIYYGYPKLIEINEDIDLNTEVDIPLFILEPLSIFMCHKILSPISTNSNNEATNYLARFTKLMNDILLSGVLNIEYPTNLRLENNGWV